MYIAIRNRLSPQGTLLPLSKTLKIAQLRMQNGENKQRNYTQIAIKILNPRFKKQQEKVRHSMVVSKDAKCIYY